MHLVLAQMVADVSEQPRALQPSQPIIGPQVDRRCVDRGAAVCHDPTVPYHPSNASVVLENEDFEGGVFELMRQLLCRPTDRPIKFNTSLVEQLRATIEVLRAARPDARIKSVW